MENTYALIGILLIVAISIFAVAYDSSLTGAGAYNSAYGGRSKIYGGAIKKAFKTNPGAFGKGYADALFIQRNQNYLYANKDKWDCSYGKEAETSPYPCVFDDSVGKYCCILPSRAVSLSTPTRSLGGLS